ncbi:MAG: hypothetical protein K8R37_12135 [Bacteroidales bacterium]|nr:hypothetical protein [Bacteroidales bacterium]
MIKEGNIFILVFLVLLFLISGTSCDKFEGSQTIPAYIQVDTFCLKPNPSIDEGALTQNITDVWVYVDDQIIGVFELPAIVPVLAEGNHKLTLYAGVKYNGMSGTRGPYPFYEPYITDCDFIVDSIKIIIPSISYYSNTFFAWIEDFEGGSISLQSTNNSDTSLQFIYHDPVSPDFGHASGAGYLDGQHTILECATHSDEPGEGYILPGATAPVFLEMDYNINNYLIVGLFIYDIGVQITQHPVVVLNPTDGIWKKIYINFTPSVTGYPQADYFNVYIRADKDSSVELPALKLDNIKLIHKE